MVESIDLDVLWLEVCTDINAVTWGGVKASRVSPRHGRQVRKDTAGDAAEKRMAFKGDSMTNCTTICLKI